MTAHLAFCFATGKSKPRLELRTRYDAGTILVEIADNGRGIDWKRLAIKAKEQGLPCSNAEQLTQALFADGVSTRDEVTETSGRGMGLASTRAECELLGGKIDVESTVGQGTLFRFRMPEPRLEDVEPRLCAFPIRVPSQASTPFRRPAATRTSSM